PIDSRGNEGRLPENSASWQAPCRERHFRCLTPKSRENGLCAREFQSHCQRHHKRESLHRLIGYSASRSQSRNRVGVPQPTEWQNIADQINAAFVFARADFIKVHGPLASSIG